MVNFVRMKLWCNIDILYYVFKKLVRFGDETRVLKFCYEKLRNFYNVCRLITHKSNECPQNVKDEPEEADDGNDGDEDDDVPSGFHEGGSPNGGPEPFNMRTMVIMRRKTIWLDQKRGR